MDKEKVIVTGADGFIGSNLCSFLEEDFEVTPITQEEIPNINKNIDWKKFFEKDGIVVHLAGVAHKKAKKEKIIQVNIEGTEKLCLDAAEKGIKKIIFMSSAKVNGERSKEPFAEGDEEHPGDIYSWSKLEAEKKIRNICEDNNLDYIIIRSPLVYGPNVKANFFKLIEAIEKSVPLPVKGLKNQRSFISIYNLTSFIKTCIQNPEINKELFFVSDDHDLTTPELANLIGNNLGIRPKMFKIPRFFQKTILKLPVLRSFFSKLTGDFQVDIRKAKDVLGWRPPFSVEEGIQKSIGYYKKNKKK